MAQITPEDLVKALREIENWTRAVRRVLECYLRTGDLSKCNTADLEGPVVTGPFPRTKMDC